MSESLLGNAISAPAASLRRKPRTAMHLSLMPAQPQVVLKRALVQIALGKNDEAELRTLQIAHGYIDAADVGLALALAGDAA